MNYDPRRRPIPSVYDSPYLKGNDVFGEQGQPLPTSPSQGPFIGRSSTVGRGGKVQVAQFNVANREATSVIVTLTRRDKKAPNQQADSGTLQVPLIAHITYGAGAENNTIVCDWLNGIAISVPVGSLSVDCEYPNLDTVGHPQSDVEQQVGVLVSMGQPGGGRGIRPHARYTDRLGTLTGGGGTATSIVPVNAESVQLVTTEPADYGSYRLEWASSASRATRVGSRVWSVITPASDGELVIPNGARSAYVTNLAATDADVSLIYGLSL